MCYPLLSPISRGDSYLCCDGVEAPLRICRAPGPGEGYVTPDMTGHHEGVSTNIAATPSTSYFTLRPEGEEIQADLDWEEHL